MNDQPDIAFRPESMTRRTLCRLQAKLSETIALSPADIAPTKQLETLILPKERSRVWRELADAGLRLPSLKLSPPVFWTLTVFVLTPLLLLAFVLKTWAIFFSLPELSLLLHKLTRRFAIHPPKHLTVYEAALSLTPFRHEDYKAGLWPAEDIADKVRLVIAVSTGAPFDSLCGKTRIAELC